MINAKPGTTFTATVQGETGLAGTLGVRIERADGTNETPRATAGIVELEAASGVYAKDDLVAPTQAATYILLWDTGTPGEPFAMEELVVAYTATGAAVTGLLLDELKTYLNITQPAKDEFLEMLLAGAFGFAKYETRRQLEPLTEITVTRPVRGRKYARIPDLRPDVDTEVSLDGVALVEGTDYELVRRPQGRDELPAPQLKLLRPGTTLVIVGDFGFDGLPWDLKDAIYTHAARNYHERSAMYADTSSSNEYGDRRFLRLLPPRVQEVYSDFKVPSDCYGLE